MRNARLDEPQAGIKVAGRNINNLRYADDTTLTAEGWKGRVKKLAWNPTFKKTKIMASDLITSWQIDGEKMEIVTDFIFLDSKSLQAVTAAMKLKDSCPLEGKLWHTWTAY